MRQHLSFREHFRRGNAASSRLPRYGRDCSEPFGTRPFELRSQLEQQVLRQKLPYSWMAIGNPSARPALR
jgi:hypothetical protein